MPQTHLWPQLTDSNEVDVGAHERQQAAIQGRCCSGAARPHPEARLQVSRAQHFRLQLLAMNSCMATY